MLHDTRSSRLIQHRDQRLSDTEIRQNFVGLKGWIDAEGICRCLDIFHIRRGVGVQRVLDLVSKLGQHFIRHILGALGDKVNAHALGADQFHHLFDLIPQCFGNIVEQQMRFVKEEHHPRFLQIPHFRQDRVQFREHPEQEGGIQCLIVHQFPAVQHVDHALSADASGEPVSDIQRRLRKKLLRALGFQRHHIAQDRGYALLCDVAVLRRKLRAVLTDILQHGLQILRVDEQQILIVRNFENDRQNIGLGDV